ncbi:DUF1294 domain-containing protein [Lacisediminimonas profundi]|uniref:DUF1294 domain-containing protein n=1 Tax=Lacisediminimonas profundi TaxID=2603856 RepID=UPI001F5027E7|nr:cold shock and DUF1294 domain-containing protein [Lacisediminimonas profundi]
MPYPDMQNTRKRYDPGIPESRDPGWIQIQTFVRAGVRYQGKITSWKDDQGFGFITRNDGGKPAFVHISAFSNRKRRPVGSELVTYELKTDPKGREQAHSVAFVGERSAAASASGHSNIAVILSAVFLSLLAGATLAGKLPLVVPGLYVLASAVAFVAYAIDKSAARDGRWRIQESTLHLFALAGGWPGAAVAQRLLRHKSSKPSFQAAFVATAILNCGALAWLLSSHGARLLRILPAAI